MIPFLAIFKLSGSVHLICLVSMEANFATQTEYFCQNHFGLIIWHFRIIFMVCNIFLFRYLTSSPCFSFSPIPFPSTYEYQSPYVLLWVSRHQTSPAMQYPSVRSILLISAPLPHQGAISSTNALSVRPGWWSMCASLYLGPHRRRVLNFTIASYILSHTKPHISEYSCFILKLRWKAILWVAACASATGILLAYKTKGVKWSLHSRQLWRPFFLFLRHRLH